jgi:hypothetical protein
MWRTHQVRRLVAISTVLCAGLLVEVAVAQTPTTGCSPTITGPNATCSSTTIVTKPVPVSDGTTKRVTGAQIDTVPGGTLVRVTDTSGNVGVSLVLEAHYFFKEWLPFANC